MTKQSDPPRGGRRLRPGDAADRIAGRLAQSSAGIGRDHQLLAEVEEAIRARTLRNKYIPSSLLGEPVWDICLGLLRAELMNRPVTVAELGVAARLPEPAASRWVELLVRSGMCSCGAGLCAAHSQVSLTAEGGAALRGYFGEPQVIGHRP